MAKTLGEALSLLLGGLAGKSNSKPRDTATRTIQGRTFPDTPPPGTERQGTTFAGLTFKRPPTNYPGQQRSGGYTMGTPSGDSASANIRELKSAFSKGGMSQEEYDARLKAIRTGNPDQWERFHKPKKDESGKLTEDKALEEVKAEPKPEDTIEAEKAKLPESLRKSSEALAKRMGLKDEALRNFWIQVIAAHQGSREGSPSDDVPEVEAQVPSMQEEFPDVMPYSGNRPGQAWSVGNNYISRERLG